MTRSHWFETAEKER